MNMFGPSTRYYIVLWAFIIGFFLPVPFWLLHKKFPNYHFDKVNMPMILVGLTLLPGAASSYFTVSFILVLFSQWYLRRWRRNYFVKYNYLVSTALDSATSLMVFFIAFALNGAADGNVHSFPLWWGNRQGMLSGHSSIAWNLITHHPLRPHRYQVHWLLLQGLLIIIVSITFSLSLKKKKKKKCNTCNIWLHFILQNFLPLSPINS